MQVVQRSHWGNWLWVSFPHLEYPRVSPCMTCFPHFTGHLPSCFSCALISCPPLPISTWVYSLVSILVLLLGWTTLFLCQDTVPLVSNSSLLLPFHQTLPAFLWVFRQYSVVLVLLFELLEQFQRISLNIDKIHCCKKAYTYCGQLGKQETAERNGEGHFSISPGMRIWGYFF